jgi:hypothetical protein
MTFDRGLTGDLPVNILPVREVDPHAFQSTTDNAAIPQLIEKIYTRLNGYAAVLCTIFRNRCETISAGENETSTR